MQGGSYDCGLFAIAFATALAHGMDPVECFFDQRKLRRHLYQCLVAGKLTPFPQAANRPASKRAVVQDEIEIHCHCRMPELKNVAMIECCFCLKWFHVLCDDVDIKCLDNSDTEWLCKHCR